MKCEHRRPVTPITRIDPYSFISDMMHALGCRVAQIGAPHRITHACCLSRGKRDVTWIASNA